MSASSIMSSFVVLVFALLAVAADASFDCLSSSSGRTPNRNYDLSGSALTRLYNSRVYLAERMSRPIADCPVDHSGVRVTLADGTQYLIHKGSNYGDASNTVVTHVRHMSSNWRVVQTHDFEGTKRVADFVAAGGSDYRLIFDNCHHASDRMMNQ